MNIHILKKRRKSISRKLTSIKNSKIKSKKYINKIKTLESSRKSIDFKIKKLRDSKVKKK